MNIVMIIPTGIGCAIGGHAGDANPVAKLLGSICDNLILHPNVVNASDINEMPDNALYVEGSALDRFLQGKIVLKKIYTNKILLVTNAITIDVINSVNAARTTIGADIEVLELETPLDMIAEIKDGTAGGTVVGWIDLVNQISKYDFDALAITSPITVSKEVAENYLCNGGINPWGGVEAKASKLISDAINKSVAHSPLDDKNSEVYNLMLNLDKPVDPRMSAELVSVSYLHCILKGLHKAPRIVEVGCDKLNPFWRESLSVRDVDFLVSPRGCWGPPHEACVHFGIPIIIVKENKACTRVSYNVYKSDNIIFVENYLEAVGYIQTYKAGVSVESVRRPIKELKILK